jgi:hypothetical protein
MVRRLVEHQQVDPRACSRASAARVRSPGERDAAGRGTCAAVSPNFASSVHTSDSGHSGRFAPNARNNGSPPRNSSRV